MHTPGQISNYKQSDYVSPISMNNNRVNLNVWNNKLKQLPVYSTCTVLIYYWLGTHYMYKTASKYYIYSIP